MPCCAKGRLRKILLHIWKKKSKKNPPRSARIFKINALEHFGAAVDACFFVLEMDPAENSVACEVFDTLAAKTPSHTFGFVGGHIIHDVKAFKRQKDLLGPDGSYAALWHQARLLKGNGINGGARRVSQRIR